MRILVISQFYPPEMGAPAARFSDFARHWIANGHEVNVITGFPNFPSGVIPPEYRGKIYLREIADGVTVHRGYIFARPNLSFVTKALGYATFLLSSILIMLSGALKCDVIISTSPPPMTGIPGVLGSWIKRKPLVFDVRDIWPEALVQSDRISSGPLIRFLERIEMGIYRTARLVTVVTDGKRERLVERGLPANKVFVVSNGVDLELYDLKAQVELPPDLAALVENFLCFTYAGVFNPSQGLDVILDAASILRDRYPDVYEKAAFVLIGGGSRLDDLKTRQAEETLDHVHFVGVRSRDEVYGMLHHSVANLVTLRKRKDLHTVPSKIYEALASKRPILLSAEGEPAAIVEAAGAGYVSNPGDAQSLAENVAKLVHLPDEADRLGHSGRMYCERNFDRRRTAARFISAIQSIVG